MVRWQIISFCLATTVLLMGMGIWILTCNSPLKFSFQWYQSHTGGGGYITGFVQDPRNPEVIYARCDVAGMFKSVNGGKTWEVKNREMMEWHHHSVESICISPHNSDVIFRCSGDARAHRTFGTIHKSDDGGESWRTVTEKVDYFGNGPDRMYGETIAVSLYDSTKVIAGGYSSGIFRSNDLGETWKYTGLRNERIGVVAWHPYLKNTIYVGTISDLGLFGARESENLDEFLSYRHDAPRGNTGKLFISEDNGLTWKLMYEKYGFDIAEIEFYPSNPKKITVLSPYNGLFTSTDGGKSFDNITTALPDVKIYSSFDVHLENDSVLIVALRTPDYIDEEYPIPIFFTTNHGLSWQPLVTASNLSLDKYPSYIRMPKMVGWAISNLKYDLQDPDKIYFSNWYGVSQSSDGGKSWSGNYFSGLETNCLEHIEEDPLIDDHVYYTVADHSPVLSTDGGKSYSHLPKPPIHNASSSMAKSMFDSTLLVYGGINRGTKHAAFISIQNKEDLTVNKAFAKGAFVQGMVEDPFHKGTFFAFVDGELLQDAGLYKSTDFAKSWNRLEVGFPAYMNTVPHRKYFIEAELLPIAVYQIKNVCGSDQLLALDPFIPNRIYLGERSEGLFISENGGNDWSRIHKELPFGNDTASVLNVILPDPVIKGVIYAGFIQEGLWKSSDFGKTWKKIFPKSNNQVFNVSSIAINEHNSDEIYISCETLHWSKAKPNLLVTFDGGKNWKDIYDRSLGALRIKGIDYSEENQRIYVATSGNGAFYVQKNKN